MYRHWLTASLLIYWLCRSTAASSLNLYSDSSCQNLISTIEGNDTCTPITLNFNSFQADSLNLGCAVTVYGANNAFCGLGDKWQATGCHANKSISQFTIDCPGALASTPAGAITSVTSSTFSTVITSYSSTIASTASSGNEPSNTTSTIQQPKASSNLVSGSALSSEDKIALGVGIPSGLAALITILLGCKALSKWCSKWKKRDRPRGQRGP